MLPLNNCYLSRYSITNKLCSYQIQMARAKTKNILIFDARWTLQGSYFGIFRITSDPHTFLVSCLSKRWGRVSEGATGYRDFNESLLTWPSTFRLQPPPLCALHPLPPFPVLYTPHSTLWVPHTKTRIVHCESSARHPWSSKTSLCDRLQI